MKDFIQEKFAKVLEKINNQDLREKTIQVWVNAAKEGNWQPQDIEKIPFTLLTDCKGINLIEHTLAVTNGAEGLAKAIIANYKTVPFNINFDYLYVGGLLHDVGKLLEIEYVDGKYQKSHNGKCTRHPISGSILAAKVGFCDEIINTIANHAKEGEGRPQRIETILIHQADFSTFNPMVMIQKQLLIT